jgi:hypothetical protein
VEKRITKFAGKMLPGINNKIKAKPKIIENSGIRFEQKRAHSFSEHVYHYNKD